MDQSTTIGKIAPAFVKAQGEIKKAVKETENDFTHKKYADLSSVIDACREALSKNDLAVIQAPVADPDKTVAVLETVLLHSSGEYFKSTARLTLVKTDPQGYGGGITYLRRYALAAMVGIVQEDDDANDASGRTKSDPRTPAKTAPRIEKPPGTPDEREARQICLNETFDAVNATNNERADLIKSVCKKHKVQRAIDLPDEKWKELLKYIGGIRTPKNESRAA